MEPRVRVDNLRELRRYLRDLGSTLQMEDIKRAFRDAAEQVAIEAKLRANAFSFTAADTIRPGAGNIRRSAQAWVRAGSARVPWYGWADFGSRTPRTGQPRSVGPWNNSGAGPPGGRFIYPAIAHTEDRVNRIIERGVAHAFRDRGFDVSGD